MLFVEAHFFGPRRITPWPVQIGGGDSRDSVKQNLRFGG